MRNSNRLILVVVVVLGAGVLAPGRMMADQTQYPGLCTSDNVPNPGGSYVITNSCSRTQVLQATTATNTVNAYQTTVTSELGSGPFLFDASFNLPYSDAVVQAEVLQAENDLFSAGAASDSGPTLVSSTQSLSSSVSTVTSAPVDSGVGFLSTTTIFGPATILVDNLGLCQGLVAQGSGLFSPTGCSGQGTPFVVFAGQTDQNINGDEVFDINQVTTTTDTTLTSQTYNLDGVLGVSPVLEPASICLLGTGLLTMVGSSARRRLLRMDSSSTTTTSR